MGTLSLLHGHRAHRDGGRTGFFVANFVVGFWPGFAAALPDARRGACLPPVWARDFAVAFGVTRGGGVSRETRREGVVLRADGTAARGAAATACPRFA
ncbi:hypothetical protein [Aquabacterium sp.]|uniref:hypothetical protein n=1 Tax=Aquabacterium sp. TaxID=1872578 RepID=UPI003D083086